MSQYRGGGRAQVNKDPFDPFDGLGLTGYLRKLGGADPETGRRTVNRGSNLPRVPV